MSSAQESLRFISTFLSHSSKDHPLGAAVADALGRRGVLAWLDREELALGPLDLGLKQAVQQQATLTLFLSESALTSAWCKDELRWALDAAPGMDHLLPVYLGDPLALVRRHELLRTRFLHPDGDRVNQLGVVADPAHCDPEAIAEQIARAAIRRVIPQGRWTELIICFDQRGNGPRRGRPAIPDHLASREAPVLTYRPNLGPRQPREVLLGEAWRAMARSVWWSLGEAAGTVRGEPRKVRVLGQAQTSLWWVVGQYFDRTTSAELFGYGPKGDTLSNKDQPRDAPLEGGNPARAQPISGMLLPTHPTPTAALGVGPLTYAEDVKQAMPVGVPLLWLESGHIDDSAQAMDLVRDLVATVRHLRSQQGLRELLLCWTSASHMALLAAANLTPHVIPQVRYLERDHARGDYEELPLPGNEPASSGMRGGPPCESGGADCGLEMALNPKGH